MLLFGIERLPTVVRVDDGGLVTDRHVGASDEALAAVLQATRAR